MKTTRQDSKKEETKDSEKEVTKDKEETKDLTRILPRKDQK